MDDKYKKVNKYKNQIKKYKVVIENLMKQNEILKKKVAYYESRESW